MSYTRLCLCVGGKRMGGQNCKSDIFHKKLRSDLVHLWNVWHLWTAGTCFPIVIRAGKKWVQREWVSRIRMEAPFSLFLGVLRESEQDDLQSKEWHVYHSFVISWEQRHITVRKGSKISEWFKAMWHEHSHTLPSCWLTPVIVNLHGWGGEEATWGLTGFSRVL
jgi:hypothetical protein